MYPPGLSLAEILGRQLVHDRWRHSIKLDHSQVGRCTIAPTILAATQSKYDTLVSPTPVHLLLLQTYFSSLSGVTALNRPTTSALQLGPLTGPRLRVGHVCFCGSSSSRAWPYVL